MAARNFLWGGHGSLEASQRHRQLSFLLLSKPHREFSAASAGAALAGGASV